MHRHFDSSPKADTIPIQKVAFSITEAAEASSLSRAYLYCAMNDGRLRFAKVGSRRVILVEDLRAFLQGQVV